MQKHLNPNKIWSSKSRGNKSSRVKINTQANFFSHFFLDSIKKFSNNLPFSLSKKTQSRPKIKSTLDTEYKIFKPAGKELVKENIKNSLPKLPLKNKNSKKTFSFGFKNISHLQQEFKSFSFKSIGYNIHFYIVKWKLFDRFNQITIAFLAIISIIFVSYLSFFDTYFLVKNYTITFEDASYLSKKDISKLIDEMKDNKFLGVLPSNQLWFLNSNNLSYIAHSLNPEITLLDVEKRIWPNSANIKIKTEPILLTLGINNNEYWRIGRTGTVVTEDDSGIRENLVIVDKPVYFNKSGITFQDISFTNNIQQFNRFWYIDWLKQVLKKNEIQISKINIPSLFDTDVTVTTIDGTELKFNSETISKDVQEEKIGNFFKDKTYSDAYLKNTYKYIDFRISKRIFLCQRGTECEKI